MPKAMPKPIIAEIPILGKIGPSRMPENATQTSDGISQDVAVAISWTGVVVLKSTSPGLDGREKYSSTIKRTEKMVAAIAKPVAHSANKKGLNTLINCHTHTHTHTHERVIDI